MKILKYGNFNMVIPFAQKTGKTITSLDLGLFEIVYLRVHSREDLRNRYVIRPGELHIVFAMVRAMETYIERSGIDQSWGQLGWFSEKKCTKFSIALE